MYKPIDQEKIEEILSHVNAIGLGETKYKVRNYEQKDFDNFVKICMTMWNYNWHGAGCTHQYAIEVFCHHTLANTQYMFTLVDCNDNALGFVGFSSKWLEKNTQFQINYEIENNRFLNMLKSDSAGKKGILEAEYLGESEIENLQRKVSSNYLSILILDEGLRGKGLGKILIAIILECLEALFWINRHRKLLDEEGKQVPIYMALRELSIYTSDKCTYQFYEALGCKKLKEIYGNGDIQKLYQLQMVGYRQ